MIYNTDAVAAKKRIVTMAQNFADEIQQKKINNQLDCSSKDKNTRLPLMGGK